MSSTSRPVLDHIVILVPGDTLANLPSWITESLTVLPGGTHSDSVTENKLIVFSDGVYIELIAFVDGVDPEKRHSHRWGRKREGEIVDWACTLMQQSRHPAASPEHQFRTVQDRVHSARAGLDYADPVRGGRITPDGIELKWAVSTPQIAKDGSDSSPELELITGELPFWCLDRTPRRLRVPHTEPKNVQHSCGAVGVASISICAKGSEKVARLRQVYNAIAEEPGKKGAAELVTSGYTWKIQLPFPGRTGHSSILSLQALTEEDAEAVYVSIALFTNGKQGRLEGNVGNGQRLAIDLLPLEAVQ